MPDQKTTPHSPSTIREIKFIYFDLDDTLLDHQQAERRALMDVRRQFEKNLGAFSDDELHTAYHEHNAPLWVEYTAGAIEKEELKRLRFERLLEALAVDDLETQAVGTYYLERYAEHWAFKEDARAAFDALAERYPVGVLTNGFTETQHAKLARFPELRDRLATLVISEEVGVMKPHPEVFAHATRTAGVAPAAILYVGDSFRSDVEGCRAAGWQVAWYTDGRPPDEREAESADAAGVFRFQRWDALLRRLDVAT